MAKNPFNTVDEYIASFPEEIAKGLELIRSTVKKLFPDAVEVISYNIPAFKYHGWLVYYSAYTAHYAISFPPPFPVAEAYAKELEQYTVSKSTVQFPYAKPFPLALFRKMIEFRAKQNIERESVKKKK